MVANGVRGSRILSIEIASGFKLVICTDKIEKRKEEIVMECKDCPMFKTRECVVCRQRQQWEEEFYREVELDIQDEMKKLEEGGDY